MTRSHDIIIAIIEKSANTQVRVTLGQWRGRTKVHLREYHPGAIAGEWWPGKGACLDIAKLPQLVKALNDAEVEARERGLLVGLRKEVAA